MDAKNAFEAIEAIRNTVPSEELQVLDSELATQFGLIVEVTGTVAVAETIVTPTPEAPTINSERLLATLDTALTTYSSLLDTVNAARTDAKGRKKDKPSPLEAVDQDTIRAEVEAIAANPAILVDLQAEADYFSANPETNSPAVGFDIVVIPEGLSTTDEQAITKDVQAKITTQYNPYIQGDRYNDTRTSEVTGKGYRIAFAPRHYNVPSGDTDTQTAWMKAANQNTSSTQLKTATDVEALAQINNLQATGELNDPNTRFDKSYFRRFDQAPVDDCVLYVCVDAYGRLNLGGSNVRGDRSTRALVVPQKLNA